MQFREFTSEAYKEIKEKGYLYIEHVRPLENSEVGWDERAMFGHFELVPHKTRPTNSESFYYDIGSPETVDWANGIDDTFFWMDKKYF